MMIAFKQNRRFQRKPCYNANVYNTETTWPARKSKPIFSSEKPVTNAQRQDMTLYTGGLISP